MQGFVFTGRNPQLNTLKGFSPDSSARMPEIKDAGTKTLLRPELTTGTKPLARRYSVSMGGIMSILQPIWYDDVLFQGMMVEHLYFAYAPNLNQAQMAFRCLQFSPVGIARSDGFRFLIKSPRWSCSHRFGQNLARKMG